MAFFLEQCLNAVFAALRNCNGEVFVVDNNSIDNSISMVEDKFPQVKLIANKENVGFSRANNQAIRQSNGRYVLLLNPDTVVEEDTFEKCVSFMDKTPDAGGLGVRMIDGKGKFLPESKRGLPTPAVAFYKIFGISTLFPKSKLFGKYHLGYLDEFQTHEIEVLSGAFMLMREEALDKVGLLDESFFMYGEDIDLSYRITQGGYKNFYLSTTQIIHYKGESTKKSSINYVFVFYRAMIIFAEKHFSKKHAKTFSFLINLAIYFRAGLAIMSRFLKKSILPTIDFSLLLISLIGLTYIWKHEHIEFPLNLLKIALPSYLLMWMLSVLYSSGYDTPIKLKNYVKGGLIGTAIILIGYALLPKNYQFSRLYILSGGALVILYYVLSRILLHFTGKQKFDLSGVKAKTFGIIGSDEEIERVEEILKHTTNRVNSIHKISPGKELNDQSVGTIHQLDQIRDIYKIEEFIFCAKDNTAEVIIEWMSKLGHLDLEFKIAQPDSLYLIGSNSIDTSGDLYVLDINKITKQEHQRNKKTLDIIVSFMGLFFSPLIIWNFKNKKRFLENMLLVLTGKKTLVSYSKAKNKRDIKLPYLKEGVLHPIPPSKAEENSPELLHKLNLIYARDYTVFKDIHILSTNWKNLDR